MYIAYLNFKEISPTVEFQNKNIPRNMLIIGAIEYIVVTLMTMLKRVPNKYSIARAQNNVKKK